MLEFTGKIIHIGEIQQVGANNTEKRILVIQNNRQIDKPASIVVDCRGNIVQDTYSLNIGDEVAVEFKPKHVEWNERYFNSMNLTKLTRIYLDSLTNPEVDDVDDDLPF